jgi:Ca-activated chloride channel family protein
MSFGAPGSLLLLPLVPCAVAVVVWWTRWRAAARARFGRMPARPGAAYAAPVLLLLALALTALAAARPQFGSRESRVDDRGIDLVVVLDVSNSMLATDAEPSRLGRAQTEIGALLDRMRGARAGLVVFAGKPFVRSPLTSDLRALRGVSAGAGSERRLVEPGSDLGAAIGSAQKLLAGGASGTKVMLIVSDGEDHGASIAPAVAAARAAGVRIYTAGTGTAQGAPVLDAGADGVPHARVDASGMPVLTRLDENALRQIASAGGGRYVAVAGDDGALPRLANELNALPRTPFGTARTPVPVERFQIVAVLALLLATAGLVLPLMRMPRAMPRLWPLAGAGLLVGAACSTTVAEINRSGNADYARGDFNAALARYATAQERDPSRPELYYNAGNAYDRKGEYDSAIEETGRALPAPAGVAAIVEYALGNHYAGASRPREALAAYKRALLANPSDGDAKHNLEVLSRRLTPTPVPATPPPEQPAPGAAATGEAGATPGPGQPGGNAAATPGRVGGQGTPAAAGRQRSQEEVERALADALAGIDREFSREDALRVLDLLDEQNRRAIENLPSGAGSGAQPDY